MLYIIIGIGLLFLTMAFLVTENNSKYLLSGYNTMSEAERKKVDIKSYIPFFKKFHLFMGISFIAIGLLLHYAIGESASGIFIGVYPILAYIYFMKESNKYWKGSSNKWNKIGLYVLGVSLILVIGLLAMGFKENRLIVTTDNMEFQGSYGEVLGWSEIKSIDIINELPKIDSKINGFALGPIKKGYFSTDTGEKIKLILNSEYHPYLQITKLNGEKIYFSTKEKPDPETYLDIKKRFQQHAH